MSYQLLNVLIFLPLIGALAVAASPRSRPRIAAVVSFAISLITLAISAGIWATWDSSSSPYRYSFATDWMPAFHIQYAIGADGFSLPMVVLTALLTTVCILYSWGRVTVRVREYYFFLLLLECFLQGVFCARDLILFYFMFDATLVPMYFLIAIWGGERAPYAAMKFFLYTLAGSAALLLGVLWVYFRSAALGQPTFDMDRLAQMGLYRGNFHEVFLGYNVPIQAVLFFLFALAFLVKIPVFPFHTWLPDAYVEAPTPVTAILAGVLGKMGVYGFLRLALPLFPEGAHVWAKPLMILGVISIVYGALVALAQWDLKKLVAYSSVSHMGFIALGIAVVSTAASRGAHATALLGDPRALALSGVVFEMFAHGLITGALFLLIGMLADQAGVRDLRTLTGAFGRAPLYVVIFSGVMFASMGLPGLMGFWSELYVVLGAFQLYTVPTGISALGIIITAGFFIWAMQRMAFGSVSPVADKMRDMDRRDVAVLSPLLVLMVLFGVLPALYLGPWMPAIRALVGHLQ